MNETIGLRPVGFIDLSKIPQRKGLPASKENKSVPFSEQRNPVRWSEMERKRANDDLKDAMREIIPRLNGTIREKSGSAHGLLTGDGRVDMNAFTSENGGPHSADMIRRHEEAIVALEQRLAVSNIEKSRAPYDGNEDESVKRWKHDRQFTDGALSEGALFCVLNRMLGPRFLVARTATFDDYKNGVDFMVLDFEKGGLPVCAIDEVVGDERSDERIEKKKARLKSGMELRYGVAVTEDGTLELGKYEKLPGVCASVGRQDLKALFEADINLAAESGEPSKVEWDFFNRIIGSMCSSVAETSLPSDSPVYEFLQAAEERLNRHLSE